MGEGEVVTLYTLRTRYTVSVKRTRINIHLNVHHHLGTLQDQDLGNLGSLHSLLKPDPEMLPFELV